MADPAKPDPAEPEPEKRRRSSSSHFDAGRRNGNATARGVARVGCSGWVYRDWRGLMYPSGLPQRRWFEHYATRFDTVEINNTFYRLPSEEMVEGWARQAPAGFAYATKLGAFGSHRMKLRDAISWLPNHLDRVQRLGVSMGPTLVQLPPRWRRNVERLDEFLTVARELSPPNLRWAVELREPTWIDDEVFSTLERHGAALCLHDLLADHPLICTTDWTYLRFHGPAAVTAKYQGRYGAERLEPMAVLIGEWLAEGRDIYGYFNNDQSAYAVADAAWLRERLAPSDAGTVRTAS